MKTIFMYVNFIPQDLSIGITKKILAQIATLRKMGYRVYYTAYLPDGAGIFDNDDKLVYQNKFKGTGGTWQRFARRFLLLRTAAEFVERGGHTIDYAYLRWHSFDHAYIRLLKALRRVQAKTVVEAHAYTPNIKADNLMTRYTVTMDRLYSGRAAKLIDLVAGVSDYDNIWGVRTVKIDNAIDLQSLRERHWHKVPSPVRMLSVSNERAYHGYDRLIRGLAEYYKNGGTRAVEIKLVGVSLPETQRLVAQCGLQKHVTFYGRKAGEELDALYDESDLGIGALAHHRVGMFSGSSLKTKEYFAKGLPFIYGWKEPAFDDSYPYAMRVELSDKPVDISAILKFYDEIREDGDMMQNMREFAREHYSWRSQLEPVLQVLENEL